MQTLQERIEQKVVNKSHLTVLDVAIGNIHDLLYDEYGDVLVFASASNKSISMSNLMQPDGLDISIQGEELPLVYSTHLNNTIYDSINRVSHTDADILHLVDILEFTYDLMIENDMEPEQYYDYS